MASCPPPDEDDHKSSKNILHLAMPEYRSPPAVSQPPVLKAISSPASPPCSTCGRALSDGEPLHRLRHDGSFRHHCTSCLLSLHKGMYCSICFVVYADPADIGDPGMWLTCSKCQRLCHLECACKRDLATDSLFFVCHDCSHPRKLPSRDAEGGNSPNKKPRLAAETVSAEEVLAAAQIVAHIAVKQAKAAKLKARECAAASAKAAAKAKAALDTAYRAGVEESRFRNEVAKPSASLYPGKGLGSPAYTGSNPSAPRIQQQQPHQQLQHHQRQQTFPRPVPHEGLMAKRLNASSNVNASPGTAISMAQYQKMKRASLANSETSAHSPVTQVKSTHSVVLAQKIPVFDQNQKAGGPKLAAPGLTPSSKSQSSQLSTAATLPREAQIKNLEVSGKTFGSDTRTSVSSCTLPAKCFGNDLLPLGTDDMTASSNTCPITDAMSIAALESVVDSAPASGAKELKPLSPADVHTVDDFVDVALLLAVDCVKEKQLPNGIGETEEVPVQKDPVSSTTGLVDQPTGDKESPGLVQLNAGQSIDSEIKYDGADLVDKQGKHVHDDNTALATEVH